MRAATNPNPWLRALWVAAATTACVWAMSLSAPTCGGQAGKPPTSFKLETASFRAGGDVPAKFTCQGEDVSPALKWTDPPSGTKSFVLIVDDPDAPGGTFIHWIATDIPAGARAFPEGINRNPNALRTSGGKQGRNGFGRSGYNGPCPPPGNPHRYFFRLYALDSPLKVGDNESKGKLEEAMKGHILATAELMGKYQRK